MTAKTTNYVLGDTGDLNAPKDSPDFVRAAYLEARSSLNDTTRERNDLRFWINTLREDNRFQKLTDQRGRFFMLWEQFCIAPQPFGLGYDPDDIDYIIQEREKTPAQRAEQPATLFDNGGDRKSELYHNTDRPAPIEQRGEAADYLTARIARDRPDIHQRMKAGEYRSVRAAALEAGIVKPRISAQADPESVARAVIRSFTIEQIRELIERLVPYLPIEKA